MLSVSVFVCVFSTCNMRARHKWHSFMICMSRCTGFAMNPAHFSLLSHPTTAMQMIEHSGVERIFLHLHLCQCIWHINGCLHLSMTFHAFGLRFFSVAKYFRNVDIKSEHSSAIEIRFYETWFLGNQGMFFSDSSPNIIQFFLTFPGSYRNKSNFNRSPSDVFGPLRYYELTYCVHNLLSAAKLISFGSCFQRFSFRMAHISDSIWHTHTQCRCHGKQYASTVGIPFS